MRIRTAAATSLLALGLLAPAAHAGFNVTIAVEPTTVNVEQTFTVTGTTDCNSVAYTVTFSYTNLDDEPATATATGTTDASGEFSQQMTVPGDALPNEAQEADPPTPPSVQASVACGGGSQQSNQVTMTIAYAEGVLSTDKASGRAGDVVHVSATNCLGDEAFGGLTDGDGIDVFDVELNDEANTFAGDYTVPNFPPGEYFFVGLCNGTEYNQVPFTLLATPGTSSPTPVPSETTVPEGVPTPVAGPVSFTG